MNELAGRWTEVGRAIVARREKLRMQQVDLVKASGLSDLTVRRLETAGQDSYWPDTKHRVCDALGWTQNSIDLILEGKRPVLAKITPPADDLAAIDRRVDVLEQAVRALLVKDPDLARWLRELPEARRDAL